MNNKSTTQNYKRTFLFTIVAILALFMSACVSGGGNSTTSEEESGTELALDETYDEVRNGARLFLTYDPKSNSFNGFVENTTNNTLKRVRVEVHLSSGEELGPTTPTDLNPGESVDVKLIATKPDFDGWSAHPEVGESGGAEHGEESETVHEEEDSD